jgi:hypothetical protein
MMWRYKQFMTDCNAVLPVRKRVSLRVKPRIIYHGVECEGLASFLPYAHVIEITDNPLRGFWSVLAHEWVHAHISEAYPSLRESDHGDTFQLNAAALEYRLQRMGWHICQPLFNEKLDA